MISWVVGLIFALGLLVSGMTRRYNILSFLWIGKDWNPSLLFVLGAGVLIGLISFTYMIQVRKNPVYGDKLFNPKGKIDWKIVVGSLSFGLGWGIGGICPGPALVMFAVWTIPIHLIWLGSLLFGMLLAYLADSCSSAEDDTEGKLANQVSNDVQNESKFGENDVTQDIISIPSSPMKIRKRESTLKMN